MCRVGRGLKFRRHQGTATVSGGRFRPLGLTLRLGRGLLLFGLALVLFRLGDFGFGDVVLVANDRNQVA